MCSMTYLRSSRVLAWNRDWEAGPPDGWLPFFQNMGNLEFVDNSDTTPSESFFFSIWKQT